MQLNRNGLMANVWLEYSVNMFDERQVANLAALLLGIAMDPSSDVDLQDYVKKTIENLCNVYCLQSDRNETVSMFCST